MNSNDINLKQSLRRIKKATLLISFIAAAAIVLSVYAFIQKREADEMANIARKNMMEALQQQKIALEQRNIADSNKEQALQQRELALESERRALEQRKIADTETRKAEESRLEALKQQYLAQQEKLYGQEQAKIAKINQAEAKKQQGEAEVQRSIANDQKQISNRLNALVNSRKMAKEALLMSNEHHFDSSKDKALQAYMLNKINKGPEQNNDIYDALNINWVRSINYKNQLNLHNLPVHCISGIHNSNIIFTADESGMLVESVIKNDGSQKVASYAVKEEVRALAVSPDGNKLVAITAFGNGMLFRVSAAAISLAATFKFDGMGKAVIFDADQNIILLTTKGIGKYHLNNMGKPLFLNYAGINNLVIGRTGKFYIAKDNQVRVYTDWNVLANGTPATIKQFDSKVTSVAVDNYEQFMAAGTYNGYVWMTNLKNNTLIWSRALHLSVVNDLKFAMVDNDKLQLASASADQSIKLINVTAIAQKNLIEDILTLKGHTKWIYALYYAQNGRWLCSAGEDNKVIAWKPTMNDLYNSLTDK